METQISCIKYQPYLPATTAVTGVLTETDTRGIHAAEMRFLKSTLGVTRQDRLTNEAIMKTLKVNSLNDAISKYRTNWFNSILKGSDDGVFT
jgi:hypothetical protein